MTRKLTRNYSFSVVASSFAILIVLVAQAALAQMSGPGQPLGEPYDVFAVRSVGSAEREPLSLRHWQRLGVDPTDSNPPIFLPAVTYGSGGYYAKAVAVADVNNDGKPDVVVANCAPSGSSNCYQRHGVVGVLLGNGDGTFQPAKTHSSGGYVVTSVAVGDVNGDGRPDLVVASWCADSTCAKGTFTLSVLLGNGDGTFHSGATYSSGGTHTESVAVADVNGDGKLDIVATNGDSGTVAVLLGNGDGTFQPVVTYDSGGSTPFSVAVADVNGDGKPDLVVTNSFSDTVGVLLGNGDGTFQAVVTYDSGGSYPFQVAVADVNGDGKPDLAVTYYLGVIGHTVGVLLGNGDGTFQAAVSYDSGNYDASTVMVADVNGDGRPDLVVGGAENSKEGSVGVLLNNTGSRSPTATTLASSLNPSVFGQAVTFTAVASASSGTPTGTVKFFDGSTWLGSATTVNGSASLSVSSLAAGTHSITAAYQGSFGFAPSTSAPLNQVVSAAMSATSVASSLNPAVVNQPVTYTAAVTSQYGGAETGTVTFQDGGVTIATVTLAGNHAAYKTKYAVQGTHAITAIYSGDANNTSSISPSLLEEIKGFPSKTVLTTSGSPSFVGQPVTFTATVTSTHGTIPNGELVTFYDGTTAIGTGTTAGGVATFTTSALTVKTHTIEGTYAGDTTFAPSTGSVKQVVDKNPTTTALSSSLNPLNYGQAVTLTATVTPTAPYQPTGTVTFKNGPATLGIGTLNASGVATLTTAKIPVGANTLTATYNGDAFNGKSVSAAITQTVSQASVSMVLTSAPNPSAFPRSVHFTAMLTSNGGVPSGQTVTFSYNDATLGTAIVGSKGVATFSTTTLPRGSDAVTAAYAGSVDYSSASATVTQVVN